MTYTGVLRPYQQEDLAKIRTEALCAYAIGLGKTHLALAFAEREKIPNSACLVLCPASLQRQWREEIQKWTNSKCIIIEGEKKKREELWLATEPFYFISTYEKLRLDAGPFNRTWRVVIADEATKIGNIAAEVTRRAWKLRSVRRLALSGTPIANNPLSLYGIMGFTKPYIFGNYFGFKQAFCVFDNIETPNGKIVPKVVGFKNLRRLHEIIKPFLFLRKKEEVLKDLPPLTYETRVCDIGKNRGVLHEIEERITENIWEREAFIHLLSAHRMLCAHPKLLMESPSIEFNSFGTRCEMTSPKLDILLEMVEGLADENKMLSEKMLIFTEYKGMAKLICDALRENGYRATYVTGDMSAREKDERVLQLRSGLVDVMINTDCMSLGLNLQEASVIVNFDLPWSPATFIQRVGRAHRSGQEKPVMCVNLIMEGTIEERVLEILQQKAAVANEVLEGEKVDSKNIFDEIAERMAVKA